MPSQNHALLVKPRPGAALQNTYGFGKLPGLQFLFGVETARDRARTSRIAQTVENEQSNGPR